MREFSVGVNRREIVDKLQRYKDHEKECAVKDDAMENGGGGEARKIKVR